MNKKLTLSILSAIFIILSPFLSCAAEIKLSNNTVNNKDPIAWSNCIYLNSGKSKPYDKKTPIEKYIDEHYRIGFILNEIYYDISIEKIESPKEEGDHPVIVNSYMISGSELADKIGLNNQGEVITDIRFVKWDSWNSFTLEIHKKLVHFKIMEDHKVVVSY
jgi:hypothetical protein